MLAGEVSDKEFSVHVLEHGAAAVTHQLVECVLLFVVHVVVMNHWPIRVTAQELCRPWDRSSRILRTTNFKIL